MLAKAIAEIHEMKLRDLNKLINNNIDEFENGIDILDLIGVISNNSYFKTQLLVTIHFGALCKITQS